jgi:hypothetical protein
MDWFEIYQRMIYPRTPIEEVEYSYSTTGLEEIAESASNILNLLESRLIRTMSDEQDTPVIAPLLEYLGALKTIINSEWDNNNSRNNCLAALEANFTTLLEEDFDKFIIETQSETQYMIQKYLKEWDNFVHQVSSNESEFTEYWNTETNEPVIYDYSEDYQDFLIRIEGSPSTMRAIDYWDYLAGLAHRYIVARYIQLAECFFNVSEERAKLSNIDELLKTALIETPVKLLSETNRRFFPPDYFWWYYMIPANLFLIGSE